MTTVYQIIVDAYRQSNLVALGVSPTELQETEALRYLGRIVSQAFGNEVGDPLTGFPIGRNNIARPSGYPWYNVVPDNYWFVPKNTRCNLNLNQTGVELFLHPAPDNGSRFAVTDASSNLSSYPVVVHGNGAFIEGAESVTLNTNSLDREWFYREDKGEWVRCSPLALFDEFPFPSEFDDYFIISLAFRLNPAYQREIDPQSKIMWDKSRNALTSRYSQVTPVDSEIGLLTNTKMTADRNSRYYGYSDYRAGQMFNKGWPY